MTLGRDNSSDTTRNLAAALGLLDDAAREQDRDIALTHIEAAQGLILHALIDVRRLETRRPDSQGGGL
jgi:hypothetical protein